MQTSTMFPSETQADITFPAQLSERYRPQAIKDFVGLEKPKAILQALVNNPRPCALLFTGPPGSGKTSLALAFAKELNAGLIHHASAKLTVDAVSETMDRVNYYPQHGEFWVIVCDEAERMSYQAQVALLSPLDSTATLRPKFGGGFEQGKPLPVIWIFTCNGQGEKQTIPPDSFEPRFLSRCLKVAFETDRLNGDLTAFLARVWNTETSESGPDFADITREAHGSVRDALQALELELLVKGIGAKPAASQEAATPRQPASHTKARPVASRKARKLRPTSKPAVTPQAARVYSPWMTAAAY